MQLREELVAVKRIYCSDEYRPSGNDRSVKCRQDDDVDEDVPEECVETFTDPSGHTVHFF
ncbi:hypothetical protein TELCIR_22810 [Teladorsagia circumcincta]|uniref:Uncharacterized protein n=1 Tax=Teladorsagia circumcincta TaxID=45464 RepID=A0A2G9TCV4_TELCI|nr:hypothetical protein TELCIR_22810 [Teladorsagia circumcincta]